MPFFQTPIIKGDWGTPIDTFSFKAFQKNDEEVEIKMYKKRALIDDEIMSVTTTNNDFYNVFVPNLNVNETPLNLLVLKKDPTPRYTSEVIRGNWSCNPADKAKVLASMPATIKMTEYNNSGGKRHKRSSKKRSDKKRKSQKKHGSHKKSHRRRHWIY